MIKSFLKTSSIYLSATIVEKVIALFFFAYIARLLSIQEMGQYALYSIYATVLSFLISLEIKSGYGRFYVEYKGEARKHFEMSILIFSLFTNLLFASILYFFYDIIKSFIYIDLGIYVIILLMPFTDTIIYIGLYKARFENKDFIYTGITISKTILNIFFFFLLTSVVASHVTRLFLSLFLSGFVVSLFVYFSFFHSYQKVLNKKFLTESTKFSLWLIPSSIGSYFSSMTDRIMIEKMTNTANVGIYSAFQRLSSLVILALEPLYNAFMPNVMKNYKDDSYDENYYFMFNLLMTIMFVINITIAVFAKECTLLLLGPKYIEYYYLIYLFLMINIFIFIARVLVNNIHLAKKSKYCSFIELFSGILNVVLNFIFIKVYGFIGAIFATVMTYFLRFCLYNYYARALFYKFKIRSLYFLYYFTLNIGLLILSYLIQGTLTILLKLLILVLYGVVVFGFFLINIGASKRLLIKEFIMYRIIKINWL